MIIVKIKTKKTSFTVPVPYAILSLASSLFTSKRFIGFVNKAIEKESVRFQIPYIEKKDLMPLLAGLSRQKGLTLVETRLRDGIEVRVNL